MAVNASAYFRLQVVGSLMQYEQSNHSPARTSNKKEPFLLFRAGDTSFAVAAHRVEHLLENPVFTPIDTEPDWLAGLLHLPQTTAPAIDLRRYFDITCQGPPRVAITVRLPFSSGGQLVALLADRLLATEKIAPRELRPLRAANAKARFRQFGVKTWRGRSRPCYVLEPDSLFSRASFSHLEHWWRTIWPAG
ncbi:MAG: chemotaxis protein CheW [Bryobacteraceae bacterium]|nr:chemotaxis protein CheW [Bryobacteraceae bacterium]MDW8379530.1 chemotaxis protein CheW [Bryobacterales bacterium]